MNKKIAALTCLFPFLISCALQPAQQAEDAKTQFIGMSKEQIFTCMGPPAQKSSEGATEIWSYPSGNGRVDSFGTAGGAASGGGAFGIGSGFSEKRFCVVNLVMTDGRSKPSTTMVQPAAFSPQASNAPTPLKIVSSRSAVLRP